LLQLLIQNIILGIWQRSILKPTKSKIDWTMMDVGLYELAYYTQITLNVQSYTAYTCV